MEHWFYVCATSLYVVKIQPYLETKSGDAVFFFGPNRGEIDGENRGDVLA